MVTKVSSTEFENMWNAIVKRNEFDSEYAKTHWAGGNIFTLEQIERNKPKGWNRLKKIISKIEESCVIYYFCTYVNENSKCLFFIVYGDDAIYNYNKIRGQCNKMTGINEDKRGYDAGSISNTVAAQCPLF